MYSILAFYIFTSIEDPKGEVKRHKLFFKDRDITSRIYISEQGINGQMSASKEDADAYIEWMHGKPEFKDIHFKIPFKAVIIPPFDFRRAFWL